MAKGDADEAPAGLSQLFNEKVFVFVGGLIIGFVGSEDLFELCAAFVREDGEGRAEPVTGGVRG